MCDVFPACSPLGHPMVTPLKPKENSAYPPAAHFNLWKGLDVGQGRVQ
jgi:hypothetical protein